MRETALGETRARRPRRRRSRERRPARAAGRWHAPRLPHDRLRRVRMADQGAARPARHLRPRDDPARARGSRPEHQGHGQSDRAGARADQSVRGGRRLGARLLRASCGRRTRPVCAGTRRRWAASSASSASCSPSSRRGRRRSSGRLFTVFWVLGAFQLWAWALARMYLYAYPATERPRAEPPVSSAPPETAGAGLSEPAPTVSAQAEPQPPRRAATPQPPRAPLPRRPSRSSG